MNQFMENYNKMALTNEAAKWVTAGLASAAVGIYYAYQNQFGLPDLGYTSVPGCAYTYYGPIVNLDGIAKLTSLLVGATSALSLLRLELTDKITEKPNCNPQATPQTTPTAGTPPTARPY